MLSEFHMVFGLGAALMLLGFFLVVRGIGASESESAIKLIGIEIRASRVGPGVLFALFGLVLVITAIIKLSSGAAPAAATAPAAPAAQVAPAEPAPAPASPARAVGSDLVDELARHNVHGSQGEASLRDWTGQGTYYRRLAEATLAALGPRRFTGAGVDLLKVNYFYLREIGVDDEAKLAPDHAFHAIPLGRALVLAHRDMNGGAWNSLSEIAQ